MLQPAHARVHTHTHTHTECKSITIQHTRAVMILVESYNQANTRKVKKWEFDLSKALNCLKKTEANIQITLGQFSCRKRYLHIALKAENPLIQNSHLLVNYRDGRQPLSTCILNVFFEVPSYMNYLLRCTTTGDVTRVPTFPQPQNSRIFPGFFKEFDAIFQVYFYIGS